MRISHLLVIGALALPVSGCAVVKKHFPAILQSSARVLYSALRTEMQRIESEPKHAEKLAKLKEYAERVKKLMQLARDWLDGNLTDEEAGRAALYAASDLVALLRAALEAK